MAFRDYRKYTLTEIKQIFQIDLENNVDLFPGFTPSGETYTDLQANVNEMALRMRLSAFDNEATRIGLLVSHVLWKAGQVYGLGVFLKPEVSYVHDDSLKLPHPLNSTYDGALSLDEIDFTTPIISVVDVKRSSLSNGLGQCIAEMYTTIRVFEQEKAYGIITNSAIWEFLVLEKAVVSVDTRNYYSQSVADIVDRIGYIAEQFKN
ncbi:MAG: hypothetical protein AAF639_21970 [Chloroflexota bacterium]